MSLIARSVSARIKPSARSTPGCPAAANGKDNTGPVLPPWRPPRVPSAHGSRAELRRRAEHRSCRLQRRQFRQAGQTNCVSRQVDAHRGSKRDDSGATNVDGLFASSGLMMPLRQNLSSQCLTISATSRQFIDGSSMFVIISNGGGASRHRDALLQLRQPEFFVDGIFDCPFRLQSKLSHAFQRQAKRDGKSSPKVTFTVSPVIGPLSASRCARLRLSPDQASLYLNPCPCGSRIDKLEETRSWTKGLPN